MDESKKMFGDLKDVTSSFAKDVAGRTESFASDVNKIVVDNLPLPDQSKEHLKKAGEELRESARIIANKSLDTVQDGVKKARDKINDGKAKSGSSK